MYRKLSCSESICSLKGWNNSLLVLNHKETFLNWHTVETPKKKSWVRHQKIKIQIDVELKEIFCSFNQKKKDKAYKVIKDHSQIVGKFSKL